MNAESIGVCFGLMAGVFFAISAIITRVGFVLAQSTTALLIPMCIVISMVASGQGIVCQTKGFKKASSVSVCSASSATAQIVGVLMGLLVLGEPMPKSVVGSVVRWFSWVILGLGVTLLASGPEGAKLIFVYVIKQSENVLPVQITSRLRSSLSLHLEIPLPKYRTRDVM
eukprot:TRINITY_DN76814_c0_g1_i2.p3 TRINITY_DN76814_c0_g1~~TRINITY_DN76814_c0_g1_i2.p3  ORF type:complete len:170 (+),score=8.72 TRINITY_DN76814_c0_g1_i2:184-693(+)